MMQVRVLTRQAEVTELRAMTPTAWVLGVGRSSKPVICRYKCEYLFGTWMYIYIRVYIYIYTCLDTLFGLYQFCRVYVYIVDIVYTCMYHTYIYIYIMYIWCMFCIWFILHIFCILIVLIADCVYSVYILCIVIV